MKRLTKPILILVLAAILCSVLAGCASVASDTSNEPSIVYGKKYVSEENGEKETSTGASSSQECLVFNKDHTGYLERRFVYRSYVGDQSTRIYSGKVDFVWRVADDGSVYLFQTKVTYDEDDTQKTGVSINTLPLSFADEFVVVMNSNGTITRFVLEGSDLAKSLEK